MRILVTGGAGFIGSHIVDALIACLAIATYDDAVETIRSTFEVLSVKRF